MPTAVALISVMLPGLLTYEAMLQLQEQELMLGEGEGSKATLIAWLKRQAASQCALQNT